MKFKQLAASVSIFAGWSCLFALVYYLAAAHYAALIVSVGEVFTNLLEPTLTIDPNPRGFVVTHPDAKEIMGVPYSLSLIGLNAIFAPALVLTTMGLNIQGVVRAMISIAIMVVLHALEISSIVLFHISHPQNTVISLGYSDAAVTAIQWGYRFLDRMSYALFPFLAWAIACPGTIASLFSSDLNSKADKASPKP